MVFERRDFDIHSFLSYIIEHKDTMLEGRTRNQLMAYLYFVNRDLPSFFPDFDRREQGELVVLTVPSSGRTAPEEYYSFKYDEYVALVFTFATRESYKGSVRKIVNTERGITELWVQPSTCKKIREHVLERFPETQIRYFVARRSDKDNSPSEFRPDFKRRISYTGRDGRKVLKEVEHAYGVHPTSIHFDVTPGIELKFYESGLFILRTINPETVDLTLELISTIVQDAEEARIAAFEMKSKVDSIEVEGGQIEVPTVLSGDIILPNARLDVDLAQSLVDEADGFSFLDVVIKPGSLIFSATVVDENKDSVFGLSATEDTITLVPHYQPTFETYLRFRRHVAEVVDPAARLVTDMG